MVLKNHIAYRFLHDPELIIEMCETTHPDDWKELAKLLDPNHPTPDEEVETTHELKAFIELVSTSRQKAFYITDTVLEKLDMLKVNKKGAHFDWMVFKGVKDQKITLILPDNKLLRIKAVENGMELFWLTFKKKTGTNIDGTMYWVMNHFNTDTGELSPHFDHPDSIAIEEFMYKLMCFFFLTENDEVILNVGKTHGTKKEGKVLNSLKIPVTIVNSRWNTTVIITGKFGVRGHFRVQPCGSGRKDHKIIFIEPFEKNGYVRNPQKDKHLS
jgi:hypothetical protein